MNLKRLSPLHDRPTARAWSSAPRQVLLCVLAAATFWSGALLGAQSPATNRIRRARAPLIITKANASLRAPLQPSTVATNRIRPTQPAAEPPAATSRPTGLTRVSPSTRPSTLAPGSLYSAREGNPTRPSQPAVPPPTATTRPTGLIGVSSATRPSALAFGSLAPTREGNPTQPSLPAVPPPTATPRPTDPSEARFAMKGSADPLDTLYILREGDMIELRVFQEDELNARVRVDQKGLAMLPLLGAVAVGGKTVEQARQHVEDLLAADYLVHPRVLLSVAQFAARRFSVMGQVQRPGFFNFHENEALNLLQAISMAGGYTRLASPGRVTVKRVVEGRETVLHLDANAMAKGETKIVPIQPEDTIIVGERIF